jgi:hypothetical protein
MCIAPSAYRPPARPESGAVARFADGLAVHPQLAGISEPRAAKARRYGLSVDRKLIKLCFFLAQFLSAAPKRIAGM